MGREKDYQGDPHVTAKDTGIKWWWYASDQGGTTLKIK